MKRWIGGCVIALIVLAVFGSVVLRQHLTNEGTSALKIRNGKAALQALEPLARLGDRKAQELVGLIYAFGYGGVTRSHQRALYWFRQLGARQNASGNKEEYAAFLALHVAKMYAEGVQWTDVDILESKRWIQIAAENGSVEAAELLKEQTAKPK